MLSTNITVPNNDVMCGISDWFRDLGDFVPEEICQSFTDFYYIVRDLSS